MLKSPDNYKTAMTIFGGLTALALVTSVVFMFKVLPYSEVFISLSEFAAKLTMGSFGQSEETAETNQESVTQVIETSPKGEGVADSLISLSGHLFEFEAEKEDAEKPEEELTPSQISGPIIRKTYTYNPSSSCIELPFGGLMRNDTDIDTDYLYDQCTREPAVEISLDNGPLVLIMHTHTTESYEDFAKEFYDETDRSRTTDLEKSVAAVGAKIAEKLEEAGIGVIHDTTVFDYPNYSGAYDRSSERVEEILEEYPSIQIVIDVHRDAIESDGVRYAPVAEIEGKTAAQVMIICGHVNVPQYRYNLRFASRLQSVMEENYPGLTRPLLFYDRNYNQELTKGSFLLEMGSSSNSLEEALYSGELVGECLKQLILELANQ